MTPPVLLKEYRQRMKLNAYAKINLCLDVLGKMEGGYHRVEMVMQQIALCDEITMDWQAAGQHGGADADGEMSSAIDIRLTTDRADLPADESNLAWKAADLVARTYGGERAGHVIIHIEKRIPMAAGLAGGSSDCAAVLHGMNRLWDLGLDVGKLCELGTMLGSDIPFCIMAQAASDEGNRSYLGDDPLATHCAIARGRGTDLEPIPGLRSHIFLTTPSVHVSTREVYEGIDGETIEERPDIDGMVRALAEKNNSLIEKNMVNVLELFTLKRYPVVVYTKNKIQDTCRHKALMSGSGPSVFCLCNSEEEAADICRELATMNEESFCTQTTY